MGSNMGSDMRSDMRSSISIKMILAFVLLALLAYGGGYMAFYGLQRFTLYSGPERDMKYMSASELQNELNVKGDIETVIHLLKKENVSSDILGIPIGSAERYYYVMPIGYQEDQKNQQYCVIAVSDPDDVSAVKGLMKKKPVPPDPNAPRFEFRGLLLDMSTDIYREFKAYLEDALSDKDSIHDILFHANVSNNLVPYVIYVKGGNDKDFLLPIIIGGACVVIGVGLIVLLAVLTYKKKHRY